MPHFFVPSDAIAAGRAVIVGPDAAHLARSLRTRAGEDVVIVDDDAVEHGLRLDEVGAERCAGAVLWSRPSTAEPQLDVTVLQAIPQQGMEDAIEAMVQAGVRAIVPIVTARTVVRFDTARGARRVERWRSVSRETAALAGRGRVPDVGDVTTIAGALESIGSARPPLLVATPVAETALAGLRLDSARSSTLVMGPEGGFDDAELALLVAAAARQVHLGPRIVRSRLAGAVATTLLLAAAGDLSRGPAGRNHA